MRTHPSRTTRPARPLGRHGMTTFELLLVLLLIVLAVTFLTRDRSDPGWRRLSAVTSDLKNLIVAQESYFADYDTYAPSLEVIDSLGLFTSSMGVTLAITTSGDTRFSAVARTDRLPERVCTVYVGSAPPYRDRAWRRDAEGEVSCRDRQALQRAATAVEADCAAGDAASCHHAAVLHAGDWLAASDRTRAPGLLEQACTGEYVPACTELGRAYRDGAGVDPDAARAAAAFERGCNGGDVRGCMALGRLYLNGQGVRRDPARAAAAFQSACRGGKGPGCGDLAMLFRDANGELGGGARAAAIFEQSCRSPLTPKEDAARDCAELAGLYQTGTGVPQSLERAGQFHQMACHKGVSASCVALAALAGRYQAGRGVPRDPRRALALYEHACRSGRGSGCAELAALNQRACEDGDPKACLRWGRQYASGAGVANDTARAIALFERACTGGDASGCFELGNKFYHGYGVPRDTLRGKEFFAKACAAGLEHACGRR